MIMAGINAENFGKNMAVSFHFQLDLLLLTVIVFCFDLNIQYY